MTAAVKQAEADGVQVVPVAMLGHKADLALMALAPDWWQLRALQTAVMLVSAEPRLRIIGVGAVERAEVVDDRGRSLLTVPTALPIGGRLFHVIPFSDQLVSATP